MSDRDNLRASERQEGVCQSCGYGPVIALPAPSADAAMARWVPMTERLPEPGQFCCIWVVDRGFYAVLEEGKFVRVGQMYPYDASQITHWHPMAALPAPPEVKP